MNKLILIFGFLVCLLPCFSQKQANIWYFGAKVGLDFNQDPPVALYNSNSIAEEGSAAISDQNGKILFYTNGITVTNRAHNTMKNGEALLGDLSSSDNAIIVPDPGNSGRYYLFTVGAAFQNGKGLRYNIIDITGDGGFGEVIRKKFVARTIGH